MPPKKRKATNGNAEAAVDAKHAKADEEANYADEDVDPNFKLEAPMLSGEVLLSGGTNWDLTGRNKVPTGVKNSGGINLWRPHRIKGLEDKKIRSMVSGPCACHSVLIDTAGVAYTFGRNDKAQLGHGDTKRRDIPTVVSTLEGMNIVDAACGRNHTLFLNDKGEVYAVGDNRMAQLGLGHQSPSVPSPTKIQYKGPPIRKIACGADFSYIVDIKGNAYSFGCPEYGQLGHNTDGQYFAAGNKLLFNCEMRPKRILMYIAKTKDGVKLNITDVEIEAVACGVNHAILLDRKKRPFTVGFGGYGRLGHAEQKDDMIPRLVKFFDGNNRGVTQVYCGSAYTMAVSEIGALFLWGQNKPTGEAAMYPKPVQDLSGWNIKTVGCANRSIIVAADDTLISWGPSPTYGELGYGEHQGKSSTTPKEVKTITGVTIQRVACGFGHALLLARADTPEDKAALEKLPVYTPEVL